MNEEWLNHLLKKKLKSKVEEETDKAAEYFRPKFEEIFQKHITKYVHEGVYLSSSGEIIEDLIECLKNPEGK